MVMHVHACKREALNDACSMALAAMRDPCAWRMQHSPPFNHCRHACSPATAYAPIRSRHACSPATAYAPIRSIPYLPLIQSKHLCSSATSPQVPHSTIHAHGLTTAPTAAAASVTAGACTWGAWTDPNAAAALDVFAVHLEAVPNDCWLVAARCGGVQQGANACVSAQGTVAVQRVLLLHASKLIMLVATLNSGGVRRPRGPDRHPLSDTNKETNTCPALYTSQSCPVLYTQPCPVP